MDRASRRVFGTHVTMTDSHVGHIDAIWSSEKAARKYALQKSTHPGVLYASVTAFTLDALGTREALVWYQHGHQDPNDRPFATALYGPVTSRHERHDLH
jgi:hypothetical protein